MLCDFESQTLQVLTVQLQVVQVPVQIIQVQPNCQTNSSSSSLLLLLLLVWQFGCNKHAVELNEQNIL